MGKCALDLLGTMMGTVESTSQNHPYLRDSEAGVLLNSHSSVAEAAGRGRGVRVGGELAPHH